VNRCDLGHNRWALTEDRLTSCVRTVLGPNERLGPSELLALGGPFQRGG